MPRRMEHTLMGLVLGLCLVPLAITVLQILDRPVAFPRSIQVVLGLADGRALVVPAMDGACQVDSQTWIRCGSQGPILMLDPTASGIQAASISTASDVRHAGTYADLVLQHGRQGLPDQVQPDEDILPGLYRWLQTQPSTVAAIPAGSLHGAHFTFRTTGHGRARLEGEKYVQDAVVLWILSWPRLPTLNEIQQGKVWIDEAAASLHVTGTVLQPEPDTLDADLALEADLTSKDGTTSWCKLPPRSIMRSLFASRPGESRLPQGTQAWAACQHPSDILFRAPRVAQESVPDLKAAWDATPADLSAAVRLSLAARHMDLEGLVAGHSWPNMLDCGPTGGWQEKPGVFWCLLPDGTLGQTERTVRDNLVIGVIHEASRTP